MLGNHLVHPSERNSLLQYSPNIFVPVSQTIPCSFTPRYTYKRLPRRHAFKFRISCLYSLSYPYKPCLYIIHKYIIIYYRVESSFSRGTSFYTTTVSGFGMFFLELHFSSMFISIVSTLCAISYEKNIFHEGTRCLCNFRILVSCACSHVWHATRNWQLVTAHLHPIHTINYCHYILACGYLA